HDPQPLAVGSEAAIDEPLTVGRHRREAVVARPGGDLGVAAAVWLDHRDLRAAFDAIAWFEDLAVEAVVKSGVRPASERNAVAAGRPGRCHDVALRILVDRGRFIGAGLRDLNAGAEHGARRGPSRKREAIARRRIRRLNPGEQEFVGGVAAEGLLPDRTLE